MRQGAGLMLNGGRGWLGRMGALICPEVGQPCMINGHF